jgi:hypothetical protein
MLCKQCGESFPKNQPFDVFEMRRHKMLPADADGMTHSDLIEDGGIFCSRKCVGDYMKAGDQSGVFDLTSLRKKMGEERR